MGNESNEKQLTPMEMYEQWFNHLQTLHASNPNRHPNQASYDATLRLNYPWVFFNLRQTEIPLICHDIGCAYGTMSLGAYSLGYRTYAVDVIDKWVNKPALDMRNIPFIQHNIEEGPVPDVPPADAVIFTEVLEHLNCNPVVALTNIRKGMKPGALLILSTPRRESGKHNPGIYQEEELNPTEFRPHWKYVPETREGKEWVDAHTYVYTEAELRLLVDLCGFHILTFGLAWNGITSGIVAYKTAHRDDDITARALELIRERP